MEFQDGIVAQAHDNWKLNPHVFNSANVGANEDTNSGKAHHSECPESPQPFSEYQKERYYQYIITAFILTVLQTEEFTQFTYHKMPRKAEEPYES